jgi:hypothetical protein
MDAPRESKSSKRIKAEYSELKLHPHTGIKAGKPSHISNYLLSKYLDTVYFCRRFAQALRCEPTAKKEWSSFHFPFSFLGPTDESNVYEWSVNIK